MSDPTHEIVRSHCNSCGQETKHRVAAEITRKGADEIIPGENLEIIYNFQMLECLGCEAVSFRELTDIPDLNWDEPLVANFPPRVSRRAPKWVHRLSQDVRELLDEVYTALHADSRRLAMMGTRTLLDLVMFKKVGDLGRFDQKLTAFQEQGYISARNRAVLEAALDAGSAAVHRAHKPSEGEVNQVMDIVENLLQHELLEQSANDLRKKTPPRTAG